MTPHSQPHPHITTPTHNHTHSIISLTPTYDLICLQPRPLTTTSTCDHTDAQSSDSWQHPPMPAPTCDHTHQRNTQLHPLLTTPTPNNPTYDTHSQIELGNNHDISSNDNCIISNYFGIVIIGTIIAHTYLFITSVQLKWKHSIWLGTPKCQEVCCIYTYT